MKVERLVEHDTAAGMMGFRFDEEALLAVVAVLQKHSQGKHGAVRLQIAGQLLDGLA